MDDGDVDGGLSFDFEGGLDSEPTHPNVIQSSDRNAAVTNAGLDVGMGGNRRNFRQTVCRHWLRGLCMKGDDCGFLHQYDKSRMPVCRFFRLQGECREQDCAFKHTNNEDNNECKMYKLGFCPNGPNCRYRHTRVPGPPPPVEEVLRRIQQLTSLNYGCSNRNFQNWNVNFTPQAESSQIGQGPNILNQPTKTIPQQAQQGSQAHNLLNAPQNQGTSRMSILMMNLLKLQLLWPHAAVADKADTKTADADASILCHPPHLQIITKVTLKDLQIRCILPHLTLETQLQKQQKGTRDLEIPMQFLFWILLPVGMKGRI